MAPFLDVVLVGIIVAFIVTEMGACAHRLEAAITVSGVAEEHYRVRDGDAQGV